MMAYQYVSSESLKFESAAPSKEKFKLIFGDEVKSLNIHDDVKNLEKVEYRLREGWVDADCLMNDHPLEMYFIDVGQGDSTFIVTPKKKKKILIDGGKGDEAFQFLSWKYRLDQSDSKPVEIDLLVVTHTDDDHLKGLVAIVQHPLIKVKKIIHSGIAKYSSGYSTNLGDVIKKAGKKYLVTRHDSVADLAVSNLTDLMTCWRDVLVAEDGLVYQAVDSRTGTIDVGDPSITLRVLAPILVDIPGHADLVYQWNGGKTVNAQSVILRLDYKSVKILLTGDINKEGQKHLLSYPVNKPEIDTHVLKAPHHGSHEYRRGFLEAIHPQITVVSSGETRDHGHPRADFLGTIGNVSRSSKPLLFSTELVALFVVDEDAARLDADDNADPTDFAMTGQARRRFKKRLNGIINVRTDGEYIYCARRVKAKSQFVTYKQSAKPRDS
jgi:beta-lactamase superfamily II metal-dependent hydrolase